VDLIEKEIKQLHIAWCPKSISRSSCLQSCFLQVFSVNTSPKGIAAGITYNNLLSSRASLNCYEFDVIIQRACERLGPRWPFYDSVMYWKLFLFWRVL